MGDTNASPAGVSQATGVVETPSISVVIPTYNRSAVVERTLRCLEGQSYPPSRFEVIVVDNSTDGTPDMVRGLSSEAACHIQLIADAPRLPAVKRNLGVRAAQGDIVLFFNDDVWAVPTLLREHADSHIAHAEPVAVLGLVEQSPEMPWTPFGEAYRPFAYEEIVGRANRAVSWRYFWSMNLSLPRAEMLSRNLMFHEDWAEIGHEDIELGYRWSRAGRTIVFNPRARGEHFHPHTVASACRLQESIGRGLRDLEQLIPERGLLERYGVFSWHNSPRSIARGLVRRALFNAWTAPRLASWLDRRTDRTPLTDWMYWKVLLHYADRGYRSAAPHPTLPRATLPAIEARS
jgi:glycosyltransferase involved in cell wall biosynthesis